MNWRGILIGSALGGVTGAGVVCLLNLRDRRRFGKLRKLHQEYEKEKSQAVEARNRKNYPEFVAHTESVEILENKIFDITRVMSGLPPEHRAKDTIKRREYLKTFMFEQANKKSSLG